MARSITALGVLAAATSAAPQRRVLQWLVPYANLSSTSEYEAIWSQLKDHYHPGQSFYAASAYALKANNASLGYATTPAGEALDGLQMEQLGMPALRALGLGKGLLGMVYVTHSAAIATMLRDPSAFIAQLDAKADEQDLAGFDLDYEPQGIDALGADSAASFMAFVERLAATLAAKGRVLTIDISGCPVTNGFSCAGFSNKSFVPAFMQGNTEDAFNINSIEGLKGLQASDGVASALGARWAPGFEPANIGTPAFGDIMAWLASPAACVGAICPMSVASWAVHEWNTGPQPDWLLDAFDSFLSAAPPPEAGEASPQRGGAPLVSEPVVRAPLVNEPAVLFDTGTPPDAFGIDGFDVSSEQSVSQRFFNNVDQTLASVEVWLMSNSAGAAQPSVNVSLREAASASTPAGARTLESWAVKVTAKGWTPTRVFLNSTIFPELKFGVFYFVVLESNDKPGSDGVWSQSNTIAWGSMTANGAWQQGGAGQAAAVKVVGAAQPMRT